MQSIDVLYKITVCYVFTEREPWSFRVQKSLCARTLLHILYVMNVHQAFWICNSADTNMHAQIEEISNILASKKKNLAFEKLVS